MKALVIASRYPWPAHTGDRLRTAIWIEALRQVAGVTLVSPAGTDPLPSHLHHVALRPARHRMLPALVQALRERLPLHSLMAAGFDWGHALEAATRREGSFDVTVTLLPRCAPWVATTSGRQVLDAIDSISRGMEERARASRLPLRWLWQWEASAARRLESRLGARYPRIVVVDESERHCFGEATVVVPNGVEIHPLEENPRRFDFGFWGHLRYFANRDALDLLLGHLWPRIRQLRPESTLLIGGAAAPPFLRRLSGRDGIEVISPIEDRPALLRQVRIALLPLRVGSGQSNKVLEAAEAGCAIAGTAVAFRGLDALREGQLCKDDGEHLARECGALASDEPRRATAGAIARQQVVAGFDRAQVLEQLLEIAIGEPGRFS